MKTMDDVRRFVASARWTFAKTMPHIPHWYTKRQDNQRGWFEAFVIYIRGHGQDKQFGGRAYTYLEVDGWKYWTMGAPVEQTIIINRAKLPR